jgi:hypothetical protein
VASKKKLRRDFVNGKVRYEDLSEADRKYIDKYARKIERDMMAGKEAAIPTYKEVPCQKWPGKTVLVSVQANIVEGSDGLLYLEEEDPKNLIVSQNWKYREAGKKAAASRKKREEKEKAVIDMAPTVLGED